MHPNVSKSEGRIYFAGEHTSALMGPLEGAAESGVRAARLLRAGFESAGDLTVPDVFC